MERILQLFAVGKVCINKQKAKFVTCVFNVKNLLQEYWHLCSVCLFFATSSTTILANGILYTPHLHLLKKNTTSFTPLNAIF